MNSKMCINNFHAHSEGVPVKEFHPDHNYIILENNRKITYDYLVVAVGL
jgi:NADH dehydrogenase FAD-containing subunit